ncbi:ABC transporter substrate-binding protein [Hansschlegelia zhihuaiae]|uniref:Amino acid ABC transporter substrate-binding protein n=1 Tax=Hansschlegelia zhihuaiae TaxID=405005 RepID=A0A4Q0MIZ2_9HYPH|nr:ABC transporter substrate-binding protein [Hansschlegelia zhihuaiae]RXF73590.1 amino acid ABC transporter substrate-binding protein [Hansschlegelia zhihuaiae]
MTDAKLVMNRRSVVAGLGALPVAAALKTPALAQAAGDVPLGLVLPFSGATGAYGPAMKQAAELVVSQVNGAGGILGGRNVRLFIEDSETSATASVAASKKLLEVNKVELVGGFWGSPEALAAKPVILAANKVQMLSCAANAVTEGETKGLIFRLQAKSSQWGPAGAKVMQKIGAKKVTILAQQNPFIVAMVEPFKAEMKKLGGEVMDVVMYNPDQASYRAEVEKAFGPEPDAVFVLPLLTDMVSISKEIFRGGFTSKVVSLGTGADAEGKFLQAVGPEVAEGIYHLQPSPPIDSPSYARFVKQMGAPEGTVFLFAGNAWDQICITALAMEHAKTQEAAVWAKSIREVCNPPGEEVDDIVEALKMVRDGKKINFNGAGCTCDFDEKGDSLNRSFYVQLIKGGKNTPFGVVS